MDSYVGKRLDGRYEIRDIIGVGGMAVVYKAFDVIDDRIVAIKILKEEFLANEEFRRRFKNESKAIAVLSHPNIVKVYDVSYGDKLQYIVITDIQRVRERRCIPYLPLLCLIFGGDDIFRRIFFTHFPLDCLPETAVQKFVDFPDRTCGYKFILFIVRAGIVLGRGL